MRIIKPIINSPVILLAVCSLLSLTRCFMLPKEEELLQPPLITPPEITYDEIEVIRGDIISRLEVTAYFLSTEEKNLYFTYSGGRFKSFYCALGDTVSKGDILAELETGNLKNQIEQNKLLLEKARIAYEINKLNAAKYELRLSEIDVKLAQLKLEALQETAANAVLAAPISGVIAYKALIQEGDYIDAYKTVIKIADPAKLALIYSRDRRYEFKTGMNVDVKIDQETYKGEVIMTPSDVPPDADPEMKKMVVFKVGNLPGEISRGDNARVYAILSQKKDVLIIPSNAVYFYATSTYVNILDDGIKKERPVEVGIITNTEAEIIKGLKEGDKVIW